MEKITKKVLLEEINKINKMMGLSPKKTLSEQPITKVGREAIPAAVNFIKKLVTGGEKEVQGLAKEFERTDIKLNNGKVIADEIRYVGEKFAQGKPLSAVEERFTTDVLEKLYPGVEKSIQKNLEDTVLSLDGGPSMMFELERIMKNPKYSSEQISKILSDDLGIQGVSQVEVALWRNSLNPTKVNAGGIRVPKRSGMGSEPRTELGNTPKGEPEVISKPVELNPQETKMADEIISAGSSKIESPENVGILNNEVAEILDNVSVGGEGQAIENYAQQQGLSGVDGNKLYELANKMVDANQELVGAIKQQSNIISKTLEEKASSGGSKPPTPPEPPIDGGVSGEPPIGGGKSPKKSWKRWFAKGEKAPNYDKLKTPDEIHRDNLKQTAFQVALIAIDIYANGKELKNYQQPLTGLFGAEIFYTKLAAAAIDQITFSLKATSPGKVLLYLNYILSGIDFVSTGAGLISTHKPKVKQAEVDRKKAEEDRKKFTQDSTKLVKQRDELKKNLSMDSLRNASEKIKQTADSLKNSKTADSLRDAVMNRFQNQNNKLDTGGNKQDLGDPFKKKN